MFTVINKYIASFVFGASLMVSSAVGAGDVSAALTGTRTSSNPGEITGTEQWATNFQVEWTIENIGGTHPWSYTYIFSADGGDDLSKDISHILLELSKDVSGEDFIFGDHNVEGPRTFSPSDPGNSNPGLPGDLFGVKFDEGGEILTLEFLSTRAPVWGDFYAKDGKNKGEDVYAYNADFGDDPMNFNEFSGFIARPDTRMEVPEPMTMILLGSSLGAAALARRRRKS